jgi:hypothetical protein
VASVYTVSIAGSEYPTGTSVIGVPPEGYRWIIRDMSFVAPPDGEATIFPFEFLVGHDDPAVVFWGLDAAHAQIGQFYHWQGRQVIDSGMGEGLFVYSTAAGFIFHATGYQLSLS